VALKNTKNPPSNAEHLAQMCEDMLAKHKKYVVEELQDMPEIREWTWKF
jgi:xylulose-5-phosphate/fructose-6-phosphate phosphoketolase